MTLDYLIWSTVHQAWWREKSAGYTTEISEAGRYTNDKALSICASARDGWLSHRIPTEIPVREFDVKLVEKRHSELVKTKTKKRRKQRRKRKKKNQKKKERESR